MHPEACEAVVSDWYQDAELPCIQYTCDRPKDSLCAESLVTEAIWILQVLDREPYRRLTLQMEQASLRSVQNMTVVSDATKDLALHINQTCMSPDELDLPTVPFPSRG